MIFALADCIEFDRPNGRHVIEHVPTHCEAEYDDVTVPKEIAIFGLKRLVDREPG